MITSSDPWFRVGALTSLACSIAFQASLCLLSKQHLKKSPWFPLEDNGKQRPVSGTALRILFLTLEESFIWRSKVSGNIKATDQKKKILLKEEANFLEK